VNEAHVASTVGDAISIDGVADVFETARLDVSQAAEAASRAAPSMTVIGIPRHERLTR